MSVHCELTPRTSKSREAAAFRHTLVCAFVEVPSAVRWHAFGLLRIKVIRQLHRHQAVTGASAIRPARGRVRQRAIEPTLVGNIRHPSHLKLHLRCCLQQGLPWFRLDEALLPRVQSELVALSHALAAAREGGLCVDATWCHGHKQAPLFDARGKERHRTVCPTVKWRAVAPSECEIACTAELAIVMTSRHRDGRCASD